MFSKITMRQGHKKTLWISNQYCLKNKYSMPNPIRISTKLYDLQIQII